MALTLDQLMQSQGNTQPTGQSSGTLTLDQLKGGSVPTASLASSSASTPTAIMPVAQPSQGIFDRFMNLPVNQPARFVGGVAKDVANSIGRPLVTPFAMTAQGIKDSGGPDLGTEALNKYTKVDFANQLTNPGVPKQMLARGAEAASLGLTLSGQSHPVIQGAVLGLASGLQKQGDQGVGLKDNNMELVGDAAIGGAIGFAVNWGLKALGSLVSGNAKLDATEKLSKMFKSASDEDIKFLEANPDKVKPYFKELYAASEQGKPFFDKTLGRMKTQIAKDVMPSLLLAKDVASQHYDDLMAPALEGTGNIKVDVGALKTTIKESSDEILASVGAEERKAASDAVNTIIKEQLKKGATVADLVRLSRILGKAAAEGGPSGELAYSAKKIVQNEMDTLTNGATTEANAFFTQFMDNWKNVTPIIRNQTANKVAAQEAIGEEGIASLTDRAANSLTSLDSANRGGMNETVKYLMSLVSNPELAKNAGLTDAEIKAAQEALPTIEAFDIAKRFNSMKFDPYINSLATGLQKTMQGATALGSLGKSSFSPRSLSDLMIKSLGETGRKVSGPVASAITSVLENPKVVDAILRWGYEQVSKESAKPTKF